MPHFRGRQIVTQMKCIHYQLKFSLLQGVVAIYISGIEGFSITVKLFCARTPAVTWKELVQRACAHHMDELSVAELHFFIILIFV